MSFNILLGNQNANKIFIDLSGERLNRHYLPRCDISATPLVIDFKGHVPKGAGNRHVLKAIEIFNNE